jgi:hypothetical protein
MAVQFVIGRAGGGKTRYCVDAVLRALREPGERRLILLVPEQASFQMERTLATRAPGGGYWRAEVLSFSRLARRVIDAAGAAPETLGRGARALALRVVAGGQPQALQAFGRSARTPGFFAALDALIGELIGEDISPEGLRVAARQLGEPGARRRAEALAKLYAAYQQWLGTERIDPAQRLAVLRERLAAAALALARFASLTARRRRCALLIRTRRPVSTLTASQPLCGFVASSLRDFPFPFPPAQFLQRLAKKCAHLASCPHTLQSPIRVNPQSRESDALANTRALPSGCGQRRSALHRAARGRPWGRVPAMASEYCNRWRG